MKKNKYDERQSEIRSLKRRREEIWKAQRNDCWVELEEPEKHGWYVVACLRSDIANRVDADTIEEALSLVSGKCWTRQKKTGWRWKGNVCTLTGKKDWQEFTPWKGGCYHNQRYSINYAYWETLRPEVRRWFTPPETLDYWGRGDCYCNIPDWLWDTKFERCWATHYQEIDTELQQEDAWIDNTLDSSKYYRKDKSADSRYFTSNAPKSFVKCLNREFRAKSKQVMSKLKQYDYDQDVAEFPKAVKDAAWLWW